ncbi:MAG: DUF389 domain-containing protein [Actinomycetota bacterium]|nr:DUF389 domain-containing protein [Actinomycetota bacterium]
MERAGGSPDNDVDVGPGEHEVPANGGHRDVFADDLPFVFEVRHVHMGRLLDPLVVRTLLAATLALVSLLWPEPTSRVVVRLAGVGVVALGATSLWQLVRARPRRRALILRSAAVTVLGAVITVGPGLSIGLTGRVLAGALVVVPLVDLAGSLRRRAERGIAWPIARTLAALFVAAVLWQRPAALLVIVVMSGAIAFAVVGFVAIARTIGSGAAADASLADAGRVVLDWLVNRSLPVHDRNELLRSLFFEGPDGRARVGRFYVLMLLSAVIAAGGVLLDSTATVIGAMLVAPLMTPLMAIAVTVVMGWPNRLARAALLVSSAVVLVVLVGFVFAGAAPVTLDPSTNTQILGRASPTIPDLVVAIAAGAAGAFGLSRPGVSGALPGVAIAISLVPPLSVVGIAFGAGAVDEGIGALLLFASNALAIVIVGGITFVVTGLTPIRSLGPNQQRVRTASAAIVTLAVFVVGALALNGREVATNAIEAGRANTVVDAWLRADDVAGPGDAPTRARHSALNVSVQGATVVVTIVGPPTGVPSAEALQERMSTALGRNVTVELQVRVQTVEVVGPSQVATD